MSDTSKLTLLGQSQTTYHFESPDASILEVFDNQHRDAAWVVGLVCGEFTSLCPMTGQPDFGRIHLHYVPDRLCVESKSLKLYLFSYRNHGAFHEDCVNRIADDVSSRIAPRYLRVFGDFNVRGGIAIKPLALRKAPDLDPGEEGRCQTLLAHFDSLNAPAR